MKVLLVNGSPHKNGCTYTALCEVSSALNENGISIRIQVFLILILQIMILILTEKYFMISLMMHTLDM